MAPEILGMFINQIKKIGHEVLERVRFVESGQHCDEARVPSGQDLEWPYLSASLGLS